MAAKVNLNADIAEGWGAYDIGNDAAMMDIVKSANVACGMHAGDANTMHRLVMLARERGVSIGAHPGFRSYGLTIGPLLGSGHDVPQHVDLRRLPVE